MRELLETWGLTALCVHRPEAAVELVRAAPRQFDVVITDQAMPKMTGLELARQLKRLRDDLPVIIYTGHGEGLAGAELTEAGPRAVLRKPIDPMQLSQVLANCLAAAHDAGAARNTIDTNCCETRRP
jgi:CheY-like chemotaxis protein